MDGSDDIADLARKYLNQPGQRGLQQVDELIQLAQGDSRWDELGKWHRVRFRLLRMQHERLIGAALSAAK
jgi:hypothetical protein